MRQPDADTNGRNLRFVLVADPGLPSEMARDVAPRLPEDLRRRIARGIRRQADTVTAPLVADERVDVSDVAGTRLAEGDRDIGVFLIGLPSPLERNPVSTEVEPEHCRTARPRLRASAALGAAGGGRRRQATGRAGRRAAGPSSSVRQPGRTGSRVGGLRGRARCAESVIRGSWVVSLDQVRSLSSSAC
ncbi:hypothetical protein SO3561_08209 [Streptomyces olivochromogenes]|uniref:Uncharacterized protein n=1 Tax=Streptomyces olivochromogenes TaxID=1963 RepID=A0A250VR58_STROL|nr:hypothetical protein SO3561_08209 [Streptomyces olivochromogenes]